MATVYEIPLDPNAQSFSVSLSGSSYQFTLIYRDSAVNNSLPSAWVLDIDDVLGNALVHGIPLVTGIDLLAQYRYMGFVGGLIAQTDGDIFTTPTYDALGKTAHLYYVTP